MIEQNRMNYEKQIQELKKKHEQSPKDKTAIYDYAEKLFQLGNFTKSEDILKPLFTNEVAFPQAIYLLAQIKYISGNYEEAEKLYEILVKQFPDFKEKAEYGLEYVYYQNNHYSKAKNLSVASDLGEIMRGFEGICPYQLMWDESDKAVIPFLVTNPLPLIQAEIKGELYNFIIDTGASETWLDDSLSASIGVKNIASSTGIFAGGATAETNYGILDCIKFNGVKIKSLPVNLMDMMPYSAIYNGEFVISGIIGVGIFRHFLVTIDYLSNQLVLRTKAGKNKNNSIAELLQDKSAVKLQFVLSSTHFMISKGLVNGKEINIFLDSGLATDAAILLPNETMNFVNIPIPNVKNTNILSGGGDVGTSLGHFNVDTFQLSDLPTIYNMKGYYGIFPESLYFNEENGFFLDSLVSHNFFRNYKWTIDYDYMEMIFSQ